MSDVELSGPVYLEITGAVPSGAGRVTKRAGILITDAEIKSNNTPEAFEAMLAGKMRGALLDLGIARARANSVPIGVRNDGQTADQQET